MRTVYIHIGLHKTGSTLIQNFLVENREKLRTIGRCYPTAAVKWSGHHPLAWSFNVGHPHFDAESGSTQHLVEQVLQEAGPHNDIILSSEDFEFLGPVQQAKLRDAFGNANYRIIAYLRQQDDYLESEYAQHVRMEETRFSGSVQDFYMKYDFMQRYDYHRLLKPWENTFGWEALRIRPFQRHQFVAGELLRDFCAQLDINWQPGFSVPAQADANISLSSPVLRALREVNKLNLSAEDRQQVIEILTRYSEQVGEKLLDASVAESFRLVFQKSNEHVARRYLARDNGLLFCDPLDVSAASLAG